MESDSEMKKILKVFRDNYLFTKEEILLSLEKFINHYTSEYKEEGFSKIKCENVVELCVQFKKVIEETKIPRIVDKWYYYNYFLDSKCIRLCLCYCEDIKYDESGAVTSMQSTEIFELVKVESVYLSIREFASMYSVREQTVFNWIRKGRLRSAEIIEDSWKIPKICDRPKRQYEPVNYCWDNSDEFVYNEEFDFLRKCNEIFIDQDENKENYKITLFSSKGIYIGTLTIPEKQRADLEYLLISNPDVKRITAEDSIQYIPSKEDEIEDSIIRINNVMDNQATESDDLKYGEVIVLKGKYKGRIGYLDDESDEYRKGVVYWGDPLLSRDHYVLINKSWLSNNVSTFDMINRMRELHSEIALLRIYRSDYYSCTQLLSELLYVSNLLTSRYINITYLQKEKDMMVFISHATNDMEFSRALASDIMNLGYSVFLDDWSIDLGDNIINKINEGLDKASILIPIISKDFIGSVFCLDEWTSFYMRYAKTRKNSILPIIIDDSDIPALMSAIKYCRVLDGYSYRNCLDQLIKVLKKHELLVDSE